MCTNLPTTNMNKAMVACRTCLSTERRLFSINGTHLSEAYKNLIGLEVSPYDGLPEYICNYCATLLLKFNAFRNKSHHAQRCLKNGNIDLPNLSLHPISLTKSDIKIIDATQTDANLELKSDINDQKHDFDTNNLVYRNESTDLTHRNDETDLEYAHSPSGLDYRNDFPEITQNDNLFSDIKIELSDTFTKIPRTVKKSKKTNLKDIESKITRNDNSKSVPNSNEKKRGKYFESDENLRDFERNFNVDVIILSPDQQMNDVLERKLSSNYLHSPYKCELCFKGLMDEESLKKHELYQHDPSRGSIVCNYCNFRYKDKRGLNQHLKSHRLKFACKQCNYVSRTTFNAKEHFKMHTGYTHECKHCGKSYEKLSSHLTHLRIHHPSHFIWCDICGEAFIGEFGLNAHKKRAHRHLNLPFECSSCKVHFATEVAINRHTEDKCSEIACVHCGQSFDRDMALRDHLLEEHRSLKVYECEKCNKKFSRQSLHSAHYRRAHIDAKDKRKTQRPWVCEVCGKTLPNRCVLLYHQRNHTGERPYQCTQCSKSFTMRKLLQSHLRVHTSDRPYACKSCPKTFKGLSALRSHEHIHTGGQKKTTSKNRKP